MNPNSNDQPPISTLPTPLPDWQSRNRELREEEWEAHKQCLDAARYALKRARGRKFTVSEIAKLLDLASKLGRLATGIATEHVEHAWSQYYDPVFLAELQKQCDAAFAEPIDVQSEKLPSNGSP